MHTTQTVRATHSRRRDRLSRALACIVAILAVAGATRAAGAQSSKNAQLLATFAPRGTTQNPEVRLYSDVWGYRAPDGREFALLCADVGLYVVDCTNPAQPVQTGFISAQQSGWRNSTWRDVKTHGAFAFVVSEGGGGMQVIDLTNPAQPTLVTTWGKTVFGNAHNLAIDTGTGIAYVCGSRNGTHMVDVQTDPRNPRYLGTQTLPYVHDLHVQNGYAHLADQNANRYLVVDVTGVPTLTPVGGAFGPGPRWMHSAWATEDDAYCLTTNEVPGAPIGIFDIRDKRMPTLVATYRAGPSTSIPHNPFARDRVAHVSYYTEGYRAVDLTDPTNPREVAHYDTYAGASVGIAGAWGCYCYARSGTIYISDVQSGLFVLRSGAVVRERGAGTPGASNRVPAIDPFGAAYLGNRRYRLTLRDARPNANAYLALNVTPAALNLGGLRIWVSPIHAALLPLRTDATGRAAVPAPVPAIPALANTTIYAQFVIEDAAAPAGYAATEGIAIPLIAP